MKALARLWAARDPRERRVIAALAVVLGVACYALGVHSAERARAQLRASVATLRTGAARLDQQADEHQRLRAAPASPASPADMGALVQARIDAAGLSGALTRIDAADAAHVSVTFGAVSFADWLGWVAALQAQQLRVETARVEALDAPGMVSATAALSRAAP